MITLPKSLVEIGDEAFANCSAMYGQTVVAPSCVERVGKMAFKNTIIDEIITLDPVFEENSEGE